MRGVNSGELPSGGMLPASGFSWPPTVGARTLTPSEGVRPLRGRIWGWPCCQAVSEHLAWSGWGRPCLLRSASSEASRPSSFCLALSHNDRTRLDSIGQTSRETQSPSAQRGVGSKSSLSRSTHVVRGLKSLSSHSNSRWPSPPASGADAPRRLRRQAASSTSCLAACISM
jgi:hypothetical protein